MKIIFMPMGNDKLAKLSFTYSEDTRLPNVYGLDYLVAAFIGKVINTYNNSGYMTEIYEIDPNQDATNITLKFKKLKESVCERVNINKIAVDLGNIWMLKTTSGRDLKILIHEYHDIPSEVKIDISIQNMDLSNCMWILNNIKNYEILIERDSDITIENNATSSVDGKVDLSDFIYTIINNNLENKKYSLIAFQDNFQDDSVAENSDYSDTKVGVLLLKVNSNTPLQLGKYQNSSAIKVNPIRINCDAKINLIEVQFTYKYDHINEYIYAMSKLDAHCI